MSDPESTIPRIVFDASYLSPQKAFALCQARMPIFADLRLIQAPEGSCYAHMEAVVLDRLVLGEIQNTAHYTYSRSRFHIAQDSLDHYVLLFHKKGRIVCRGVGMESETSPGDLIFHDMANLQSMVLRDIDILVLVVPRSFLAPLLAEPDGPGSRHLSGKNILVKLLFEQVTALYAQSHRINTEQARMLMPSLLELVAAAVNGVVGEQTRQSVCSSLKMAICRYIGTHGREPDCSPERIAAQFGISQRKLSYLFHDDGGVATYIQHERLRLARLALMNPDMRGFTIAEIAAAYGFAHRTSFIRAFERLYSLTPSQQRALASKRSPLDKRRILHCSCGREISETAGGCSALWQAMVSD